MPPDDVAVERLLSGQLRAAQAHTTDRDAAILILYRLGLPASRIASRIGTGSDTVTAVLRRAGLQ